MGYDESYGATPALFGSRPERILVENADRLTSGLPVLDIGAGQGRHALFLARRGLGVEALDPSRVAVETIRRAAGEEALPVTAIRGSFEELEPVNLPYGGILLFGLLQILTWEKIEILTRRIDSWLAPGGCLFVTAFSVADDGFERGVTAQQQIGRNSFVTSEGEIRTYLEAGELLRLFPGFNPIHHWEGLGPEHRHGDGLPERHAMTEAVLTRPQPPGKIVNHG